MDTLKSQEEAIGNLERQLKEAESINKKLSNEVTKLTRYNKDLIGQIDLTNSKLHVLLGVCERRVDKSSQTDSLPETGRCFNCQSDSTSDIRTERNPSDTLKEDGQFKAADWARIAQEVVDSNDYILEPTSKTYYSQSTGWYYYPNEKLFFDPKSNNYYTYNQDSKSYQVYNVPTDASKEETKNPIAQESEEGELSSSESESSDGQSVIEITHTRKNKSSKSGQEASNKYDSGEDNDDESNISCLRLIVRESESLKLGSLLLITMSGALIGNSSNCDLFINDPSVSRKHARISYNQKKRRYQIVDCSSKHGVFLNDRRLEADKIETITHGDILKLAKSEFLLHHHYGKEVTCNSCEPGCVQAELLLAGRLVKDEDNPCIVIEDRHTALKKMKKRYGVSTWNKEMDSSTSSSSSNYHDRARKRRIEKGSDNPYEKTAQGTSLDKPLTQESKGFKLLKKLGWSEGQGIGKDMAGDTQPIPLISTEGRSGLGFGHS